MSIRDRYSLLRGYKRELLAAETSGDAERVKAINAEIERVQALPPVPVDPSEATEAERLSAREAAYLGALRRELARTPDEAQRKGIQAEIDRVESLLKGAQTERARNAPAAEAATAKRGAKGSANSDAKADVNTTGDSDDGANGADADAGIAA